MSIEQLWNKHKQAAQAARAGAKFGLVAKRLSLSPRIAGEVAVSGMALGASAPKDECEGRELCAASRQPCSAGLPYPHQ